MFKKWINKQTITVFIVTLIIFGILPVFATTIIKNSYFNDNLKLAINGTLSTVKFITVEVEGEQWGRNYVSVADFVKALNDYAGLNGTVDFDSASQTILVDNNFNVASGEVTMNNMSEVTTTITETPDGITNIDTWEGQQYIGYIYIRNKIKEKGYDFVFNIKSQSWQVIKGEEILLDNIPTLRPFGYDEVEVNYYINTILPLIQ